MSAPVIRALAGAVTVCTVVACHGGGTPRPAAPPLPAPGGSCDIVSLRSLELRQRNWENSGLDVTIDSTGGYVRTQVDMDRRDTIGHGSLTQPNFSHLLEQLRGSGFCTASHLTRPPAEEVPSWIEYRMTVVDEHGARIARFDNRAEAVPRDLMSLATEILRLTGGAE